jgi:hypothetical protein
MSAPLYDLQGRRAARPVSAYTLTQDIDAAIVKLHEGVASWPFVHLRESHLITAERGLVEIQRLLILMRQYAPLRSDAS